MLGFQTRVRLRPACLASKRAESARRMRRMRRQVMENDVKHWADTYLRELRAAPDGGQ